MSEARRRVIDCGVISWTAYFTTLPSNGKRTGITCRRSIFTLLPQGTVPCSTILSSKNWTILQFRMAAIQIACCYRIGAQQSFTWTSAGNVVETAVAPFVQLELYLRISSFTGNYFYPCAWERQLHEKDMHLDTCCASETVSDSTLSAYLSQNQFTSYTSAIERSNIKKLQTSHLFCRSLGIFPFGVQMMNCSYSSQGFGIAVDCRTSCFMNFQGNLERIRCCTNIGFCISCKNPEKQKLENRWPCFPEISG